MISAQELKAYIERIEKLAEEKSNIAASIKDMYAEAKSTGFDPKIMKVIVRLRKLTKPEIEEQDTLIDLYKSAMGMVDDNSH